MGREVQDCGVADLKISGYGISLDEFETLYDNAKDAMSVCFECDSKTFLR